MMLKSFAFVLSCAVATGALAQPAPAPAPSTAISPLTVQAAPKPAVVMKQTHSFVQSFAAPSTKIDQFARWHDPVCVLVTGLVPEQAAQVRARVEDVAKAVGGRVRKSGCSPNIEIAFTPTPQSLLDNVAAHNEVALGYYHRHDAKTLKTVTRPIQSWYVTATSGGGGPNAGLVFSQGSAGPLARQLSERVVDDPDATPPTGCGDSHFSVCLRSDFENVLVVVDTGRVQDLSLGLLSDYVVMLALSQPRSLDGCAALASVIDVLGAACPGRDKPDGLTPADAAYLTALYSADLEANRSGEKTQIADRMASILSRSGGGGR